ncbi:hypothetical protein TPHA_0D04070 [Tetrapisispora phaffii CBS 4417]|uniref:LYC1 C-terminal domain-containing protein n=1 Tax=Tetrapisispora phaffii (strain ATCC 24235 / CBS 4417 / NBRC 1672 / NRRL Y-8282 / UCD 70-5) TaxID=1071381 RepID=G8BT69_TETPH|nr:hypothetical protein TPHA_0D04070 [Tetrapisispora phaffii CBS 4417]CCE63040.1 hypothetical protein TPHA_0D04070 [Tetrapisispora phaffii CBS 4417]
MSAINNNNLSFELTSDWDIIHFTHLSNGVKWAGLLTLEEYADREYMLGTSEISTKNENDIFIQEHPTFAEWLGIKHFILKDTSLPIGNAKTDQIVSSCETLNRLGYCINPKRGNSIEPALILCIGGVWTQENHRGKKYAEQMIASLNKFYDEIRNRHDAPVAIKNMVITLYSEVGEYYKRVGYTSRHIPIHELTKLDQIGEEYCNGIQQPVGKFLGFSDYEDLVKLHVSKYARTLLKLHVEHPNSFVFTVAADIDIYKWFQHRDEFIKNKTKKGESGVSKFGFRFNDDNTHVIWHHNWNDDTLIIVTLFYGEESLSNDGSRMKQIMSLAIQECKDQKLSKLEFWNEEIPIKEQYPELYSTLSRLEPEGHLFKENGSISAFKSPPGYGPEEVEWANNTKFCWF